MKNDIKLFINGTEVEFNDSPSILFNYKQTDLTNPTVVKNGHSKSIEIPGTEVNNDLFGHIWNLERTQYEAIGGAGFNPLKKAPFELYANGELIEKGYCKLTNIKRENRSISYSITLFNKLGDFFYSLAYDEANEDDRKKTLADLTYNVPYWLEGDEYGLSEPDLNFIINKDTVLNAWENLIGNGNPDLIITDDTNRSCTTEPKWRVINFCPAYNGIPDDFDADKCFINMSGITKATTDTTIAAYVGSNGTVIGNNHPTATQITAGRGYSMGEIGQPITEWDAKDLRSYLQRPCLNVHRTILACCCPENNGGYDVRLSEKFMGRWTENPYWTSSWMTLPMLKELNVEGGQVTEISAATLTKVDDYHYRVDFDTSTISSINGVRMRLNPHFTSTGPITGPTLYSYHIWESTNGFTLQANKYVKRYVTGGGYIMQVLGKNANGDIVAQSKAYVFCTNRYAADGKTPIWKPFWHEGDGPEPEYEVVGGFWKQIGGEWVFCDSNSNKKSIDFEIPNSVELASIEIKSMMVNSRAVEYKFAGSSSRSLGADSFLSVYNTAQQTGAFGLHTLGEVAGSGSTTGTVVPTIESFYTRTTDYESMFSDTYIPKEKLLSTPFTPLDFLLSYCKMFGLYFYMNPDEEAEDPVRCPNGVVHILDRSEFYNGQVVDLEDYIDRSKTMDITPTVAQSKFLTFKQEAVESDCEDDYESTYGHTYGRQLVNTSWNFDNSSVDLYDGNVFKSAINVQEKDEYYKTLDSRNYQPFITAGGFRQVLFDRTSNSTYPRNVDKSYPATSPINEFALLNYDQCPRMQFHGKDNEAADGAYVLCFFQQRYVGGSDGGVACVDGGHYILTDDIPEMVYWNDGTPCWIMSAGDNRPNQFNSDSPYTRICWHINQLPFFTRDWYSYGMFDKPIVHSWNFGHPKTLFSPNTNDTYGSSIYDMCWKSYIRDLYDVDNRRLTCYVNFDERPSGEAMRRFYWFDNCMWRLNEVKDWNILGYESTKCEFVKVLDAQAYNTEEIKENGRFDMWVTPELMPATGGVATIHVTRQDCGQWCIGHSEPRVVAYDSGGQQVKYVLADETCKTGCDTSITVTIPSNEEDYELYWKADIEIDGQSVSAATFTQDKRTITPATYLNVIFPYGNKTDNQWTAALTSTTINVYCDGDWRVSSNVNWITVVKRDQAHATMVVQRNNTGSLRTGATITVRAENPTSLYSTRTYSQSST